MSEEVLGLTVGQELKTEEAIATVRDVHRHTDNNKVVLMVKTELTVLDVKTGFTEKAVLQTYISKTIFL